MKAKVLAKHFYCADVVDIDDSDDYGFQEVIDHDEQFAPFVLA